MERRIQHWWWSNSRIHKSRKSGLSGRYQKRVSVSVLMILLRFSKIPQLKLLPMIKSNTTHSIEWNKWKLNAMWMFMNELIMYALLRHARGQQTFFFNRGISRQNITCHFSHLSWSRGYGSKILLRKESKDFCLSIKISFGFVRTFWGWILRFCVMWVHYVHFEL